jgi:NAD(P)-dependent dehydrogenase (short-subunit alcohol dehydrogenase family)
MQQKTALVTGSSSGIGFELRRNRTTERQGRTPIVSNGDYSVS